MTGVAEIYLFLRRPHSRDARKRLFSAFSRQDYDMQRFVVLSWKRTGSNLLSGILHNHPEIIMHNELFNQIDIHTYHPGALVRGKDSDDKDIKWNYLTRDLWPKVFLHQIWSGRFFDNEKIKKEGKAVGFKSFADHWVDAGNDDVFNEILDDFRVKKIVLKREDELAVYVSMLRAESTGIYMENPYPIDLKVKVDIAQFQSFVNNYRRTFIYKYRGPFHKRDTFHVTYEQLQDENTFDGIIAPCLWDFLGVSRGSVKRLQGIVRQSPPDECLDAVISNFSELEYAFRHTDLMFFATRGPHCDPSPLGYLNTSKVAPNSNQKTRESNYTWSILLPICSRVITELLPSDTSNTNADGGEFHRNRFAHLEHFAEHNASNQDSDSKCWGRLSSFARSFADTVSRTRKERTEFVVGIDTDDLVFNVKESKDRLKQLFQPSEVVFVEIRKPMYGKVCRIWNRLGKFAKNDFIVLLGDDIILIDKGWQEEVEKQFREISLMTSLHFGFGVVALSDISFPGYPTFPVIHREHLNCFQRILPQPFVNQGGDPYLFELYSRWNASSFVSSRLENTLGGDSSARYVKHDINWPGQVLSLQTRHLKAHLGSSPDGICLDIVVPSYRMNNTSILQSIVNLRASIKAYVKFWIVVDNPNKKHLQDVKSLASESNDRSIKMAETKTKLNSHGRFNYFVNVVHYGENRGASHARNTGYNYSTADWCLFLDDDIIPEPSILDAYIGAILRYPEAKVFVGQTNLPRPMNTWTQMLSVSNVMYFYGIAGRRTHPPWGVTANLMVKGKRHNHVVQFKGLYPKTGGGEDIDLVFQLKDFYASQPGTKGMNKNSIVVGVPGAIVLHPWWNDGNICYSQIMGWALGDSLCLTEWPEKTFLVLPNWIEVGTLLLLLGLSQVFQWRYHQVRFINLISIIEAVFVIAIIDHCFKFAAFYEKANVVSRQAGKGFIYSVVVSLGASSVISAQELMRLWALLWRVSFVSFSRRMDWFDGQTPTEILDIQLRSGLMFITYLIIVYYFCFAA